MDDWPTSTVGISYVIPVYNEENAIADTVRRVLDTLAPLGYPFEIIVVDDGSQDDSASRAAAAASNVTVLRHPANSGYGRALKTGIANAKYDWIGIVDADGTYEIEKIPELVASMADGFDMVVAVRENVLTRDSLGKRLSRQIYIAAIDILSGRNSPDPNSGLRMFTRSFVMTFFPFLCNAFSFTTSLTVFAFGGAYFVKFVPSHYEVREGRSKVRHFRDTLRTVQLIVQGVTFFNPIKLYLLLAFVHFILVGVPATLLYLASSSLAAPYIIVGSTVFILLGVAALGDIIRVSMIRPGGTNDPETTSQTYRLRTLPAAEDRS